MASLAVVRMDREACAASCHTVAVGELALDVHSHDM